MTRFCPYCGKQLNDRSKFCPSCGKAAPQRERHASVATEEPPAEINQSNAEAMDRFSSSPDAYRTRENMVESLPSTEMGERPRTRTTGAAARSANGSAARKSDGAGRIAPPTRSIAERLEQAGFGLRYGAWMFDFLTILIAMMGATFAVSAAQHRSVIGSNTDLLIIGGLTLLLFVADFVVLAGLSAQSLGMRILGIYIVRVDGKPFKIKDALLRHVVGYPASMAVFFLGFLWMLWDPRQQGWHDKIARTMVVTSK